MGSSKVKTVDMSVEIPEDSKKDKNQAAEATADNAEKQTAKSRGRSKKYKTVKSYVDRTKFYELDKAIEIIKKASYSNFKGSVTVDAVIKDQNLNVETTFPHSTGKTVRVAIATEELLKEIEAGNTDFDVLIAEPKMMPKIARHARVLGPKGLMPNPKNKTVTDDPEARKKELEKGVTTIKPERKAPLIHVMIGKVDMKDEQLVENVQHLIKMVGPKKIKKLTLSATMSPGVKLDLTPFQQA